MSQPAEVTMPFALLQTVHWSKPNRTQKSFGDLLAAVRGEWIELSGEVYRYSSTKKWPAAWQWVLVRSSSLPLSSLWSPA